MCLPSAHQIRTKGVALAGMAQFCVPKGRGFDSWSRSRCMWEATDWYFSHIDASLLSLFLPLSLSPPRPPFSLSPPCTPRKEKLHIPLSCRKKNQNSRLAWLVSCKLFTSGRPDGSSLVEPLTISRASSLYCKQPSPPDHVSVQASGACYWGASGIPGVWLSGLWILMRLRV